MWDQTAAHFFFDLSRCGRLAEVSSRPRRIIGTVLRGLHRVNAEGVVPQARIGVRRVPRIAPCAVVCCRVSSSKTTFTSLQSRDLESFKQVKSVSRTVEPTQNDQLLNTTLALLCITPFVIYEIHITAFIFIYYGQYGRKRPALIKKWAGRADSDVLNGLSSAYRTVCFRGRAGLRVQTTLRDSESVIVWPLSLAIT